MSATTRQRLRIAGTVLAIVLLVAAVPVAVNVAADANGAFNCSAGFQVDETLTNGARWQMCWEKRAREGIVIHDVTDARHQRQRADHSAELLDLVQDFAHMGLWERDATTGEGHWDRHMFELFGVEPRQGTPHIQHFISMLVPEEQVNNYYYGTLQEAGRYSMRYRMQRRDGSMRHLHSSWEVKNGPNGTPLQVIGVVRDDTETHEIARGLDMTVEALGVGLWSQEANARRPTWNAQMFRLHGLDVGLGAAVGGLHGRPAVHVDDRLRVRHEVLNWAQGDAPKLEVEYRVPMADGSVRWVALTAQRRDGSTAAFGIAMDVSERRLTEAALRRANDRVALAARAAGIGTWEMDLATRVSQWDEQMFRLRGDTPRSAGIDRDAGESYMHPDDIPMLRRQREAAIEQMQAVHYEFRVKGPHGGWRWLASQSTIETDERGQPVRQIGVNWDVTDMRSVREALQEKAIAQRQSQAKSQFLARVSHELRTPLNAVLGFTQLLQTRLAGQVDAATDEQLREVHRAGVHLLTLIDDVLELTHLEAGQLPFERQPIALSPLLAEAVALLEPLAQKRSVRVDIGPIDLDVEADARRLKQVLINLLAHALERSPSGGSVTLSAERDGGQVCLAIADSGPALDAAQLRDVFEPFNRDHADEGGLGASGIGLAIARALTELMGGTLSASSGVGSGSIFRLNLIAADRAPAAPSAADEAPLRREPVFERLDIDARLLYVEDNPINLMVVVELVRQRTSLTLHSAATGEDGVAQALAWRPDLVLLDMQLPDIDGFEVLRRLRERPETRDIRCIALSANAMPADIERARAAGFTDYWTKPIDLDRFIAGLKALL